MHFQISDSFELFFILSAFLAKTDVLNIVMNNKKAWCNLCHVEKLFLIVLQLSVMCVHNELFCL